MPDELKAVIDLGSNSVRLVIYQQGPHGTQQEVDNLKQTVRLSTYLDADNRISDKGIQIALDVLSQFKRLCDAYKVTEIIGIATQAVRMAVNQAEVIERIFKQTGIQFQVISGTDEARYGYLAVVNSLPLEEGITVDVGGGSTEITYFRERKLIHKTSIPYGAVSLTRDMALSDPPTIKEFKALEGTVHRELDKLEWLTGLACPVVGLGGTARSIARIHQRQNRYPLPLLHGYEMWPSEVKSIVEMLRNRTVEERTEINGLSADRSDIILAGTAIVNQVLEKSQATRFVISNKGLRDGVLFEQALQSKELEVLPDILSHSVDTIHDYFRLNREHLCQVWKLADQMLSGFVQNGGLNGNPDMYRCLRVAALLHDLGRSISTYNVRNHTFYLMLQVPIFGVSHREQVIAAGIAAFKTPKQIARLLMDYQSLLEEDDLGLIAQMGAILGIARALDRTQTSAVTLVDVQSMGASYVIHVYSKHRLDLEMNLANDWLKKCKKVFPKHVRLEVESIGNSQHV